MEPNIPKAIFIARKIFAELVFDVQCLEGMPFTLPEVQTFIQGITIGGHKITDEEKLKQQVLGWQTLIKQVEAGTFSLTKETAYSIQQILAKDEAPETGRFRSGGVGIAGTDYKPPAASELDDVFTTVVKAILSIDDIREQAYRIHLDFARNQFFYDGNKRTGLLMANGHLLSNGYPPLSVPAKKLTEYNAGMIKFYESGEYEEMLEFLRRCHEAMYERFL